jgi:glycosyltransferase involved in cell wall biosynthesis
MRPTRVLVVTKSLEVWGAERTLLELVRNVDKSRFCLTFLVATDSPLATLIEGLGYSVITHRFARHGLLGRTGGLTNARLHLLVWAGFAMLTGAFRLVREFRRHDVILSFSMWQATESLIAARIARRAFVLDIHETFSGARGHRVMRAIAGLSNAVIAPSRSVLARSSLFPNDKVFVIPRPISSSGVPGWSKKAQVDADGTLTIGVFGQISSHKGVQKVVSAVADLGSDRLRLLVVGGRPAAIRPPYETEVRAAMRQLGSGSAIVDAVPSVLGLMTTCHFVVNASDHEAFGRGVVEAIACGAVPIVIGHGGPSEIVSNTGIGVVFDTVNDFQSYIAGILAGTIELPMTDFATRREALTSYEPSAVADVYFGVLGAVVNP